MTLAKRGPLKPFGPETTLSRICIAAIAGGGGGCLMDGSVWDQFASAYLARGHERICFLELISCRDEVGCRLDDKPLAAFDYLLVCIQDCPCCEMYISCLAGLL